MAPTADDPRQVSSISDLTARTGLGRTTIYAEIKRGRLVARKVGRRTVFLNQEVDRWLTSLPTGVDAHTDTGASLKATSIAPTEPRRKAEVSK